jgi:hypothetical protein
MKTRHSTSANAWHKLGSPRARRLLVLAIILLPCLALAQVPLVTQVSPPRVAPGSGTVVLVITGAAFFNSPTTLVEVTTSSGSTTPLATFYSSAEQLLALYNAPSSPEAVYVRVESQGFISNSIPLPITTTGPVVYGNASICFGIWSAMSSSCTAPTGPQAVALGDFRNSGNLDIAVVNSTANNVSILLSNGDGTFKNLITGPPYGASTLATYAVGHNPQAVAVGDFNNDGKLDLAVANKNDNTISILPGNGDGTFGTQTIVPLPSNALAPIALAAADFNGDGNLDLAVLNQTDSNCATSSGPSGNGSVYVLQNNGFPGTAFSTLRNTCMGILPSSVVAGDFEQTTGLPDLVVVNEGGDSSTTCPPANGTIAFLPSVYINLGAFESPRSYCGGQSPSAAVAGDFNNDGTLDLVVTNATASQISFLQGSGSGLGNFKFETAVNFPTGGAIPNSIVAGDFNGDGLLDVAIADQGSGEVSIMQGDGTGNFTAVNGSPYATTSAYGGRGPTSLVAADFNGDGRMDIATADNSDSFVTIMLQSPPVQFSPLSLNFSLVPEGTKSAEQTLTITNLGNITAKISSLTVSGPFQFDTAGAETTCSTGGAFTLAPGASCGVGVIFAPTSIGAAVGTVTLQTSTGVAVSASLAGMGVAPILSFSPSTVTFGATLLGTPASPIFVTVTNVGDYAATITSVSIAGTSEFTESDGSPACLGQTLAAGSGNCQMIVNFTPTVAGGPGLRTASLNLLFNLAGATGSPIPASIPLSGDGTAPNVFFTPTPLTFANQPVGTQSPASTVYLLNDGTAPLTISSSGGIILTGADASDFSIQGSTCPVSPATLAVSNSCSVSVTFTPSAEGQRTAAIQFTDNNVAVNGSTQTVGLSGTGAGPLVSISGAPVIFGNQQVGTASGPATVSLSNLGNGPLTITNVALGGANPGDFSLTNSCPLNPSQLPMFGSCSDTITFTPLAVGTRTATLTFTDNNNAIPGSTQTVTITGTSSAPIIGLSTGSVAFGAQPINTTSAPMSFKISNTGTVALDIISIAINPSTDFAQTNNCIGLLAGGTNCTVTVTFTPTATGLRTANLIITDNSGGCPTCFVNQTVSLSGTGTDFSISVSPTSQTVSPGKVGLFTVTLTPLSGFSGSVTLGCSVSLPTNGTTCTVPAGTVTLSGTAQKHIGVSVKPKKGTYTLTFSATYTPAPPASGPPQTRSTTAKLISK